MRLTRYLPGVVLGAAMVVAAGCGGGDGGPKAERKAGQTQGAAPAESSAPATLRVGQVQRYADGLELTVTRMRLAPKSQVDPTSYERPASWKGVLVDVLVKNGTRQRVKLDWGVTVTSGPNDSAGVLASYEGPGSVVGASWLGDAPLLPGRTRKLTSALVVESTKDITLNLGDEGGDHPQVTVVGDAA